MAGVGKAFYRAVVSQCHPRMLFAMLLPFLIVLIGTIVLLWLFWTPLSQWLTLKADEWAIFNTVDDWLLTVGLISLKLWLVPILAAALLLPAAALVGVAVAAVFVMPMVLAHVGDRDYPSVTRRGKHATVVSVWNAVWVMTVFVIGWVVTLPLWLFPPLGIAFSIFWWAFAFNRLMRIDAIVEHASPDERRILLRRNTSGFWALGLVCSLLNLLPPAWFILPVFSALYFAHYGLDALQGLRAERPLAAPDATALAGPTRAAGPTVPPA